MKPESQALRLMSAVRATAKMREFRVAQEDFITLPRNPNLLFAQAIDILGDAAAAIAESFLDPEGIDESPQTWSDDWSLSKMVRFSAVFFDSYLEASLDAEITAEFSLLCASSYYLSNNFGSATVVVRRSEAPNLNLGHGLARTAFAILKNDFSAIPGDFPYSAFSARLLDALSVYFSLGDAEDEVRALCNALRIATYENGSARELLYADIVTALCARKFRNAARNIIPPASNNSLEKWRSALIKPHFPIELWPAQRKICDAGLLNGKSALIQMPTSAGKTRAAEMIIRSHFLAERSKLVVIVAPFRSLCHDISADLASAFAGEGILFDEVSDSFLFDIDMEGVLARKSVLIVTPEKMLYMLRRAPELAERIGLAIYDEGHQFEGMSRGPTYELLLSSLKMSLPKNAQVILISAVIGNAAQISEWLISDAAAVVSGEGLLPTAKSIAFASWQKERGWLQYVQPNDPEEKEFFVPRVIDVLPLAKLKRQERVRVFPERDRPTENSESAEIGLYLGLHLVANGSVAIFCGQKSSVTKICRRLADIFVRGVVLDKPINVSDKDEVSKLSRLIAAHLGDSTPFALAAAIGVFGHHSNTPHGIRVSIEYAMKTGKVKFVVCTSTLAQGVNFPIKYLIVTATQQGSEKIKVRDFHNLMGRAGRAGMHTEGSVIFSDPSIFDERLNFSQRWRWNASKRLLDPANAEPSVSSILQIFDEYRQIKPELTLTLKPAWLNLAFADNGHLENIVSAVKKQFPAINEREFRKFVVERARVIQSIASYLAAYVDFDSALAGDRIKELAINTLAYFLADNETKEKLLTVFQETAKSIEKSADAEFRIIIRRSPLPPADMFELRDWIVANIVELNSANVTGTLDEMLADKLLSYVQSKLVKGLSDQAMVKTCLAAWLAGNTFSDMQNILAAVDVRIGRDKATVEHVVALCEGGFGYELSMIAASAADLLETIDDNLAAEVVEYQRKIKFGLSHPAAIVFYEAGFSDRIVAQEFAEKFPDVEDRAAVRRICRAERETIAALLEPFPSYFVKVAEDIRG